MLKAQSFRSSTAAGPSKVGAQNIRLRKERSNINKMEYDQMCEYLVEVMCRYEGCPALPLHWQATASLEADDWIALPSDPP